MNTEITDFNDKPGGWIFYDAACRRCTGQAKGLQRALRRRGYRIAPLQAPGVQQRLQLPVSQLLAEMRVLTPDGRILGGGDAVAHLAGLLWWARPLAAISRLPGGRAALRRGYRWLADQRTTMAHATVGPLVKRQSVGAGASISRSVCRNRRTVGRGCVVLIVLATIMLAHGHLDGWKLMWALCFAFYFGVKSLTLLDASVRLRSPWKMLGYLLGWPGMDPRPFLQSNSQFARQRASQWIRPLAFISGGLILMWVAPAYFKSWSVLLAGACGFVGMVLVLHFGLFGLLVILWRRLGVEVQSIMDAPLRARSLDEFWSRRWNRAFRDAAYRIVFRPAAARWGSITALMLAFGLSGILHDVVISWPAAAGFGGPTAYFLAQAVGMSFERGGLGRRLGLRRGVRGRLFALIIAAAPLPLLFHAPFMFRVWIPFMRAIGAL